jgi:hypothetical protein
VKMKRAATGPAIHLFTRHHRPLNELLELTRPSLYVCVCDLRYRKDPKRRADSIPHVLKKDSSERTCDGSS